VAVLVTAAACGSGAGSTAPDGAATSVPATSASTPTDADTATTDGQTTSDATPATDGAAGAGTRTITDTFLGEVHGVPTDPQRVGGLWRAGSIVADLGVVPVGQLDGELIAEELEPEVFQRVEQVPVVGTYEGVDIEKVIAVDPDLIIGMDHGNLSI